MAVDLTQLTRFFQISWGLLSITALFPLYLNRDKIKSKTQTLKLIGGVIVFAAFGLLVEFYKEQFNLTREEFTLLLAIPTLILAGIIIPQILELSEVISKHSLDVRQSKAILVLRKTFEKVKAQITLLDSPYDFDAVVRGPYALDFSFKITVNASENNPNKSEVVIKSQPTGSSINIVRFLFFLTALPPIIARAEENFSLTLPVVLQEVNAETLFYALLGFLLLVLIISNSVQKNLLVEIEEIERMTLYELAKQSLQKKRELIKKPELPFQKKEDIKVDISEAKARAEKIKEIKAKEAILERERKLKERVEGIYGKTEDMKKLDPKLVKKNLLITKIKNVLRSTPVGMTVSKEDVANKVGHDKIDEVEQIIISLVDRKEVQGFYNIWDGTFRIEDPNIEFVDQTLRELNITTDDIEYIRIKRGSEIEIRLRASTLEKNASKLITYEKDIPEIENKNTKPPPLKEHKVEEKLA